MSAGDSLKSMIPGPWKRGLKKVLGVSSQLNPDWRILSPTGPVTADHVVFDVGAFHGYFLKAWLNWCPSARVHAFEPTDQAMALLRTNHGADPRVTLVQSGLGETPGEQELNVSQDAGYFNSFLAPDVRSLAEVKYETGALTRRKVPVTTLDAYCETAGIKEIHLIKVDVQGFELKVLQGGFGKALPMTKYLFVESGIRPLYVGAPRFSDVFNAVTGRGFHLIGMRSYHRGNLTLVEADMLFRRDDLMPPLPADPAVDKIVQNLG